ncbi:LLM class flavin-dependent oxidoreductase [Pseudonocardia benzenivorans]
MRNAEHAGFTLATFEDSLAPPSRGADLAGRIGAVERAAFVAPLTSVIAVAPVVSTTYTEPFHVASQLASLDFAAAGRAGWVVATSDDASVAAALGRPAVTDPDGLRREAATPSPSTGRCGTPGRTTRRSATSPPAATSTSTSCTTSTSSARRTR